MAKIYNKGIVSPKGFDMSAPEPVDQREIVEYYTDLISLNNCYPGLEVKVEELGYRKYRLIALPSTQLSNWEVVESGVGPQGPQGPAGQDGDDGKSAYELYVEGGGTLTESEWLVSLKGPKGDQGDSGVPGPAGPKGDPGESLGYIPFQDLLVFKGSGNFDLVTIEAGDMVKGWWTSTEFWRVARYNGGALNDENNYTIIDSVEF